jgi:hypothetical protein
MIERKDQSSHQKCKTFKGLEILKIVEKKRFEEIVKKALAD